MGICHFNSHTREGVTTRAVTRQKKSAISTHTPVRVWLCIHLLYLLSLCRFQLTHPWGCDHQIYNPTVLWPCHFNSHTREGVTPAYCADDGAYIFQLTHPWGCDQLLYDKVRELEISTHTPVRVWRSTFKIWNLHKGNFNSHTREGVTGWISIYPGFFIFQLTHPWGCDHLPDFQLHYCSDFNSHTREGVTKSSQITYYSHLNFNSHTREGVT